MSEMARVTQVCKTCICPVTGQHQVEKDNQASPAVLSVVQVTNPALDKSC